METKRFLRSPRTLRAAAVVVAALLVVYAVIGFWVAPGIVKSRTLEALSERTGRQITLQEVSVNPFALSVTFRGFAVSDRDGEPLLSFDELYVNYQIISLITGAQTFSEISILNPHIRALVRVDGSMNFADVMPATAAVDTVAGSARAADEPMVVVIDHFVLQNGHLIYEARNRTTPFGTSLDSLSLSLRDFTTRPNEEGQYAFTATTEKGEGITWKGDLMFRPLRSSGSFALSGFKAGTLWEFMQDQVYWKIAGGTLEVTSDYAIDLSKEPVEFVIRNGSGSSRGLRLEDTRDTSEAVVLPQVSITGVDADVMKRSVRIAQIAAAGGTVKAAYRADSTLTIQTLFTPKPDPRANPDSSGPWSAVIGTLSLTDFAVPFADYRIDPSAQFDVVPLNVTLENYCYGLPGTANLKIQASVNRSGRISLAGPYVPEPLSTSLSVSVDTLPLPLFQPYVTASADLAIKAGTVSVKGVLRYSAKGASSRSEFSGDVRIQKFRAVDTFTELDFLRLPVLDLKRISYSSDPAALSISSVAGKQVYARFIVDTIGITNVQRILRRLPDTTLVEGEKGGKAPVPHAQPQTRTRIDEITVANGTLDFSDLSLRPNFVLGIYDLNGAVRGLSSEELARADVDLEGRVDRYAPATIRGQINPLTAEAFTDVTFKFDGIELTTFTPYAGKFMGYKIDKGKMSLDLRYRLNNQYLKGENKIILDQLTLGQKIEGPSVTDLPVKLAIALLKDSRGVIDLDIPVEGDLNDPEFSLFPIVLKVIVNLFVKIVTAPFALIGALFGGDEELSYVLFDVGLDSLAAPERAKLDSLSHALRERPELTLNIRGVAGALDRDRLARQQVYERIRGAGGSTDTVLTARDRDRLLTLYREQFGEDPMGLAASPPGGETTTGVDQKAAAADAALKRMIDQAKVPEETMRQLAQRRASHVKDQMVLRGGIEDARLFLQDVSLSAPADGIRVRLEMALDAR